jgi:hypothetical protein
METHGTRTCPQVLTKCLKLQGKSGMMELAFILAIKTSKEM